MCLAKCSLLVKLKLQGGYSVHQNLCDFFFLVDLVPSALTLSSSDPSCPSSESSISTSSESRDFVERCESLRAGELVPASVVSGAETTVGNGDAGRGR
jgi:hypothetical protein